MASISGSVGKGGDNRLADVELVQKMLNEHVTRLGLPLLIVDGANGPNTETAIARYQNLVLGLSNPDGRIDPGGTTWNALVSGRAMTDAPAPANPALSGAAWWDANQAKYPNSNKLGDLVPPFRENAQKFVAALIAAGAKVSVTSTLRHKIRAYLMHYSWAVAKGKIAASEVPPYPGVPITWDHGSPAKSRKGAQEMVARFGMAFPASLTSNHIEGEAVDMTITWSGTIEIADAKGKSHKLGAPRNGADNASLHAIGASYGVKKLASDPPHWSAKGN